MLSGAAREHVRAGGACFLPTLGGACVCLAGSAVGVARSAVSRTCLACSTIRRACLARATVRRTCLTRPAVCDYAGLGAIGERRRMALTCRLASWGTSASLDCALSSTSTRGLQGMTRTDVGIRERRLVLARIAATCVGDCRCALQSATSGETTLAAEPNVEIEIVRARLKCLFGCPDRYNFCSAPNEDSSSA